MALQPQRASSCAWVDAFGPPYRLVAGTVHLAVMSSAQRHCEFIADFSPHGAALHETKVMGGPKVAVRRSSKPFGQRSGRDLGHELAAVPAMSARTCRYLVAGENERAFWMGSVGARSRLGPARGSEVSAGRPPRRFAHRSPTICPCRQCGVGPNLRRPGRCLKH